MAAVVGVAVALVLFAAHVWYEWRRFGRLVGGSAAADQGSASTSQLHR